MFNKISLIIGLLVLTVIVCLFSPKISLAKYSILGTNPHTINTGCSPVVIWSPNVGLIWRIKSAGQNGKKAWYHIQTCIEQDELGDIIAQTTAFHSSGPAYAFGPCTVFVEIGPTHSDLGFGYVPQTFDCNKGGTTTQTINNYLPSTTIIVKQPYHALGWMNGGNFSSPTATSKTVNN